MRPVEDPFIALPENQVIYDHRRDPAMVAFSSWRRLGIGFEFEKNLSIIAYYLIIYRLSNRSIFSDYVIQFVRSNYSDSTARNNA